jgi:tRNA-specific 2-thiouridylase
MTSAGISLKFPKFLSNFSQRLFLPLIYNTGMKIALGMSGGVDSSVSAHLLKEAGHDVTGVFLQCWRAPGCRAEDDRKDALTVALDLGIPFEVLDFIQAYREQVVEQFFVDYKRGLTPNPDIWCNTAIKFGLFYEWALQNGFDAIATGHYAQIGELSGIKALLRGADTKKDQSYFLYKTRQEQLDHIVFPIGHLQKSQVREEAQKRNILVAAKPDSQGICFIGDINVHDFLREHLGENQGDVLDVEGNVIGRHQGVWFYTIGQRHGFELFPKVRTSKNQWKHVLPPMYVVSKDAENNTITVGYGAQTMWDEVELRDVFWRHPSLMPDTNQQVHTVKARIRHGGELYPAQLRCINQEENTAKLVFNDKIKGLAPGQAVVFYSDQDDMVCLGGAQLK